METRKERCECGYRKCRDPVKQSAISSRRLYIFRTCVQEARVWRATRQGEPGCAMNYDRWAGELAAPLKSRLIYYYVLLLLFGYLYPYNIMPREIPGSRRYVTARGSPGIGTSFSASVIT